jgi:hypothetical protein
MTGIAKAHPASITTINSMIFFDVREQFPDVRTACPDGLAFFLQVAHGSGVLCTRSASYVWIDTLV